ncbi:DUF3857 domain-containing protein [Arcticibacter eurypsychrophilus]|uniref:DUF3857 domain-containing protein n=1 Tax=Arcticibacter eurypsychrophilus TaxID=1434752 RepID=UPI00084DCD1D|nr:DUF3857 domain-containing protein [Arcticibacter eurypsychrophilus]
MKKLLICLALSLCFIHVYPADFPYGVVSLEDLNMKVYSKDTSANAVVLQEFGNTRISSGDGTPLMFEYHVRIKIFNASGFNQGNIVIPIYKSDNERYEEVSEIKGSTFFIDHDGMMRETKLDPKMVIRENKDKHHNLVKFAMPDLTNGCVIEYVYTLNSPYRFNFRNWYFQDDIPKVYSEYIAHIPGVYNYNTVLVGGRKLTKNNMELERECFTPGGGVKADCSKITYIMADIPAFVEEDYMTAASNFKSAIRYELSDYVDYRGIKHQITKEWKDVDYDLKKDPYFGNQMRKKELFKTQLPALIAGQPDALIQAKNIYSFCQKWFKWNGFNQIYSVDGLKKAVETHSGSIADINLALISVLNEAGLNADAVLLSTRSNGVVNNLFPILTDFNYVVARLTIADKTYMLDATDPFLPFGLLPIKCINDRGRVISMSKPSYWIDLVASQKESKIYNLALELLPDGKIKGNIIEISLGYEAYNKRKAIKKFNSVEEYVENLDESMPKTKIISNKIVGLDSLDAPLSESYVVEINAYDNLNKGQFAFNPFFMDRKIENPFKLMERNYPVDWGAPSDIRISLICNFPEGFEVISKPEPVALALPAKGGRFTSEITIDGSQFIFQQMTLLNKSIYQPEEYPYLKELFNKMVQVQKTDVIFRKKQ